MAMARLGFRSVIGGPPHNRNRHGLHTITVRGNDNLNCAMPLAVASKGLWHSVHNGLSRMVRSPFAAVTVSIRNMT